jgi:hypothetical protein
MNFFKRFKQIQFVEVPKGLPQLDHAGRLALAGLAEHPGFNYLINRIRIQRAALESGLKYGQHQNMNDVLALQSGIRWLTWVENQFLLAVERPSQKAPRDPNADELEALQNALSFIEGVGETQ